MRVTLLLAIVFSIGTFTKHLQAINADNLVKTAENPFNYDLHLQILPNEKKQAEVLISMHGMGSDHNMAEVIKLNPALPYHIVTFNFPDYGLRNREVTKSSFGTFEEIAPALFVLKKYVIDQGIDKIHLYGFSAGGGVIVNVLAILNSERYDNELQKLGISETEKKKILRSIEKGSVILEVPLKSFDEVADVHGGRETRILAKRARENRLVPIDNLPMLKGLSLNVFVYFATPDDALGNRDDRKYIELLKNANGQSKTLGIIGKTGGHTNYHPELWQAYKSWLAREN